MPQVGHSRPVTRGECARPESKLSVRAEATRVRLQRPCHYQKPRQTGRRDQEQTANRPTQWLTNHGGCRIMGGPPLQWTIAHGSRPNEEGSRKEIGTYSK